MWETIENFDKFKLQLKGEREGEIGITDADDVMQGSSDENGVQVVAGWGGALDTSKHWFLIWDL